MLSQSPISGATIIDTPEHRPKPERKRLSAILDEIAADESRARIAVADLVTAMEARAYGALLLIFALPNVLPAPPGTSGILGLPLLSSRPR